MNVAMKVAGENFTGSKKITPVFNSEPEAAVEFSAVILPFSTGEVARDAGRSKDTVKCWKAGRAFPNGVSLMNLAQRNPTVRAWMLAKLGASQFPQFMNSPTAMNAAMAAVYQVAHQEGPDGEAVRAILRGERNA